jgi:hypothetical protein
MMPEEEASLAIVTVILETSRSPMDARVDLGVQLFSELRDGGQITMEEYRPFSAECRPMKLPTFCGRIVMAAPELSDWEWHFEVFDA